MPGRGPRNGRRGAWQGYERVRMGFGHGQGCRSLRFCRLPPKRFREEAPVMNGFLT